MQSSHKSQDRVAIALFAILLAVCTLGVAGFIIFATFGPGATLIVAAAMVVAAAIVVLSAGDVADL